MKKFLLAMYFLLFLCFAAFAEDTLIYSSDKTADALIRTGNGNFYYLWAVLDGTNDVTFAVYDGTDNTGTLLVPSTTIKADELVHNVVAFGFDPPIRCSTGIYIDITTTGTVTYKVYYNTIMK